MMHKLHMISSYAMNGEVIIVQRGQTAASELDVKKEVHTGLKAMLE